MKFRVGDRSVPDSEKGRRFLEQASELGHVDSQFALAELLREHYRNVSTTVRYSKRVSDREEIDRTIRVQALRSYGILLHHDKGIDDNIDEISRYLLSAARSGDLIVQFELRELLFDDRQDLSDSKECLRPAMVQGHDGGRCRYVMLFQNELIEENDPEAEVQVGMSLAAHFDCHDIVEVYCKLAADQGYLKGMYRHGLRPSGTNSRIWNNLVGIFGIPRRVDFHISKMKQTKVIEMLNFRSVGYDVKKVLIELAYCMI
jgi:TPR repeat protein